jgi:hypothetical protein
VKRSGVKRSGVKRYIERSSDKLRKRSDEGEVDDGSTTDESWSASNHIDDIQTISTQQQVRPIEHSRGQVNMPSRH